MAVEALTLTSGRPTFGLTPQLSDLPNFETPDYLRKNTLKLARQNGNVVPESIWEERGTHMEKRGAIIIKSQTNIVTDVTFNPKYTPRSDVVIELVDGLGVKRVKAEFKSSPLGIQDFKDKVRKANPELFPKEDETGQLFGSWVNDLNMQDWLTQNDLILMNVSEYKTEEEILKDSFYPQLERILLKYAKQSESVQVFPEKGGELDAIG